jgi:hypothetical protein
MSDVRGQLASAIKGDVPGKFWPDADHAFFYERSVSLIAGPSGVGKSLVVVKQVADLTRTGNFVIYCNAEDDPVMQMFRLAAAGADMDKVLISNFLIPSDLVALEVAIRHHHATLVVFDTAAKHLEGPLQRWDKPLKLLNDLCAATKCTAMFVHHTNKNVKKSMDWRAAIGGATAGLIGTARSIALCGRDSTGSLLFAPVKDSYAEAPKAIRFDFQTEDFDQSNGETVEISYVTISEKGVICSNPTELVVVTGDGDGKRGPSPEVAAAAGDLLCTALANGPLPVNDTYRCMTRPDSTMQPSDADWKKRSCGQLSVKSVAKAGGCCPDCNGNVVEVEGLKSLAEAAGVSFGTLKRVKPAYAIESGKKGFSDAAIGYWMLPAGHPSLDPTARDYLA